MNRFFNKRLKKNTVFVKNKKKQEFIIEKKGKFE